MQIKVRLYRKTLHINNVILGLPPVEKFTISEGIMDLPTLSRETGIYKGLFVSLFTYQGDGNHAQFYDEETNLFYHAMRDDNDS